MDDDPLTGSARSLNHLRLLGGLEVFQYLVVVTTGWTGADELFDVLVKEDKLRNSSTALGMMIEHGCRTARFDWTQQSAVEIFTASLNNVPRILRI